MELLGFKLNQAYPCGSAGKESACNVGDMSSIPALGRSPREGKGYPIQFSGLENSMDCIVHGVTKSQTQLTDFHFHFQAYQVLSIICIRRCSTSSVLQNRKKHEKLFPSVEISHFKNEFREGVVKYVL